MRFRLFALQPSTGKMLHIIAVADCGANSPNLIFLTFLARDSFLTFIKYINCRYSDKRPGRTSQQIFLFPFLNNEGKSKMYQMIKLYTATLSVLFAFFFSTSTIYQDSWSRCESERIFSHLCCLSSFRVSSTCNSTVKGIWFIGTRKSHRYKRHS